MEKTKDPNQILAELYSLLVPKEILIDFEITGVINRITDVTIELTEKPVKIPEKLLGKDPVHDGFMNDLELQNYPVQGKSCYLKIKKRRWKEKGSNGSQSFWNEYSFTAEGTKATKDFGAFLKEYLS